MGASRIGKIIHLSRVHYQSLQGWSGSSAQVEPKANIYLTN